LCPGGGERTRLRIGDLRATPPYARAGLNALGGSGRKPVSVELIPMPSSSRSPIVSPDVQSDAASSTSFNVEPTKPIVLQHVQFDADSIGGASASGPRTLPIAAVRAVIWPGRRLWARGLGVGALLGGVLIHQHVRAAVEQAVHEELAEVLGVELYERSEARRRERNDEGADVDWADRRAGYKSRPHEKHLAQISSSDTPVVVMEATEYGDCVDPPLCRERSWNRLLVTEGLVRTRFVVKADVLGDDAPEVILTEDEDVVEHCDPRCGKSDANARVAPLSSSVLLRALFGPQVHGVRSRTAGRRASFNAISPPI
ncbi:MAG TPA: hypothetical protein VE052_09025, partial [Gemmatimonadaceae bacterium]|nr:hypothetical protein [Gemmatimonadaceae bacterium]